MGGYWEPLLTGCTLICTSILLDYLQNTYYPTRGHINTIESLFIAYELILNMYRYYCLPLIIRYMAIVVH